MNETVFLTGASGFIGHYLCEYLLEAGYRVRLLYRSGSDISHLSLDHPGLELFEGDLLDIFSLEDALADCQLVVHAGALVSFQKTDKDAMYQVNRDGTANLMDMALEAEIKHVVYLSSVAALDRVSNPEPPTGLQDNWHHRPAATHYARSKFAAEREVWRCQAEGLSVSALYPSIVLGAGDWLRGGGPGLFHKVAEGQSFYPSGSTGFVDVRDVCAAALHLLETRKNGTRILCNAANLSWKDFLDRTAKALEVKPPGILMRSWQTALAWPLAGLAARITGHKPFLTRATHRTAQSHFRYDGSSFEQELGRSYTPIAQSIQETALAYRSAGNPPEPVFLPVQPGQPID